MMLTKEEKKAYLERYAEYQEEIRELVEEKKTMWLSMSMPKAIIYSDMPKGSIVSDTADHFARLQEVEEKLKKVQKKCTVYRTRIKIDINNFVTETGDVETARVIYKKYLMGKSLRAIAEEEGYSLSKAKALHREGLETINLANVANNRCKC